MLVVRKSADEEWMKDNSRGLLKRKPHEIEKPARQFVI
jgi:hypothetical protein